MKKTEVESPSLLELLDQVEAEMNRLREENRRGGPEQVKPPAKPKKPQALGKGLSQLLGTPRKSSN